MKYVLVDLFLVQLIFKWQPFHSQRGVSGETNTVGKRVLRFAKNGSYVIRIDWSKRAIDWNPVCPSIPALHPNYFCSPIYLRVYPRSRNISPEVITRVDSGQDSTSRITMIFLKHSLYECHATVVNSKRKKTCSISSRISYWRKYSSIL